MNINLSKIIDLINTGSYKKAELDLQPLIAEDPDNFILNKAMGICLMSQYKYLAGIKAFETCASQNKKDYDVLVNLSFLYVKIQDYKNSLRLAHDALSLNNSRPEAYNNIAECYFYLNDFQKAEENILIAIEKRGGLGSKNLLSFVDSILLYADVLLALKKKDEFLRFAYDILDKGNHIDELMIRILRLNANLIKPAHIQNVKKVLNNLKNIKPLVQKKITESNAYFFLAEYLEKQDKNKSEAYIIKANQIIADMQRDSLFKRQSKIKSIINTYNLIDQDHIKKQIDKKKGEGLIFIIGMPRSGTTLLESIVATSNDCQAGGEKLYFTLECNEALSSSKHMNLDYQFFEKLGDKYLEIIDIQRKDKKFYIDKMPENYAYYNFINLSLPAAKFIHIYRDPWDNAVSLFKQNYVVNLFYASSFFGIAMEYANYEHLVQFWKTSDKNDNKFLNIEYADLVNHTEKVAEQIWSYCGLPGKYDGSKRTEHFSVTASKNQVTKEIYASSLKKSDFQAFKDQFYFDLENQRNYWNTLKNNN